MGNAEGEGDRRRAQQEWLACALLAAVFLANELMLVARFPLRAWGFLYVTLRAGLLPAASILLVVWVVVRLVRFGLGGMVRRATLLAVAGTVISFCWLYPGGLLLRPV